MAVGKGSTEMSIPELVSWFDLENGVEESQCHTADITVLSLSCCFSCLPFNAQEEEKGLQNSASENIDGP